MVSGLFCFYVEKNRSNRGPEGFLFAARVAVHGEDHAERLVRGHGGDVVIVAIESRLI
jgi:hypothetical protein